jgi:hypothetical protein
LKLGAFELNTNTRRLESIQNRQPQKRQGGKRRIGDDWIAITVIALSQQSPLKAVVELAHNNFPGLSADHLLERMVELSIYTEEHLK